MLTTFFSFWSSVPLRWRFFITSFSGIAVMFTEDVFVVGTTPEGWMFLLAGASVILVVGELIIRDVHKGIVNLQSSIAALSRLDLSKDAQIGGQLEMQHIATDLNKVIAEWRTIINTNLTSSRGMVEAVAVVEGQCHALREMSEHQRNDISSMTEGTVRSKALVHDVESRMSRVNSSLQNIGDVVQQNTSYMAELIRKTEEVSNVSSVIKQISEQINLLALNAAIEAARAGDAGRGFAVVADEVRKLSNQSANAVSGIDTVVEALTRAVHTMEEGQQRIVETIQGIGADTASVTQGMSEQTVAIDDISSRVENFAGQIEEVHHNVEQTTVASANLESLAGDLNALASRFRV